MLVESDKARLNQLEDKLKNELGARKQVSSLQLS